MDWSSNPLFETAFALGRAHAEANPGRRRLPPFLFLTDPERTPEPWLQAARLPVGAGVIFRGFGRPDAMGVGHRLADLCHERGLTYVVGTDPDLAETLGAAGVHLPERLVHRAPDLRIDHPDWLITGAAHSEQALRTAAALDAAVISPVFASASPSAGEPLGVKTLARLIATSPVPVYALGGVTPATAPDLASTGACGLAGVSGI